MSSLLCETFFEHDEYNVATILVTIDCGLDW
jgi:hypothetical protein